MATGGKRSTETTGWETQTGGGGTGDIKVLVKEQKQMQERTTAELGLLPGGLGELWGDLQNQITRMSDTEESMPTKVSIVEESMSNKISEVEENLSLIHI